MRRVAYLWSEELMRVADQLPANQGRSRLVHGLVHGLGLVDLGSVEEHTQRPSSPPSYETNLDDEDNESHEGSDPKLPSSNGGADQPSAGSVLTANGLKKGVLTMNKSVEGRVSPSRTEDGFRNGTETSPTTLGVESAPTTHGTTNGRLVNGYYLGGLAEEGDKDVSVRVIAPDPQLCEAAELRRYHDASYVDYLLYGQGVDTDEEEEFVPRKKRRKDRSAKLGLEFDCPPFPALPRYAALVAGATLTACRVLARGEADTAIVWDGGRHHAGRSKASGFCYVADAVLGILLLCREGVPRIKPPDAQAQSTASRPQPSLPSPLIPAAVNGLRPHILTNGLPPLPTPDGSLQTPAPEAPAPIAVHTTLTIAPAGSTRRPRIMYLDLDLHYGDGVARAFACPVHFPYPLAGRPRPPQVLTLSVHHVSPLFFPPGAPATSTADTPHPFNLSLGLAEHASPPTYARLWANIEKIHHAWEPDYVILQLGVDGLPRDPIGQVGGWGIHGEGGVAWAVERVMGWKVPTVVLGGGGYHHANTARAWATATSVIVSKDLGPGTEIPDDCENMDAFGPGFTLEIEPSHVPDKTEPADLDETDAAFDVIAARIRDIRGVNGV